MRLRSRFYCLVRRGEWVMTVVIATAVGVSGGGLRLGIGEKRPRFDYE